MAAAFTTRALCVRIDRQSFYFSDKKKAFLQSFTHTSIVESIQLGKNELDSIVAPTSWLNHYCKVLLQQQILLIALCKLATEPELKENWNSQGKHKFMYTYCMLLSTSSCSGPPNQFWHSFGALWIPSKLETVHIPRDHQLLGIFPLFSSWLVLSTHWRKWFLLPLTASLRKNCIYEAQWRH